MNKYIKFLTSITVITILGATLSACGNKNQSSDSTSQTSTVQANTVQESKPKPTAKSTYSRDFLDRTLSSFMQNLESCAVSEKPKSEMLEVVKPYVTDNFKNSDIVVLYATIDEAQNRKPVLTTYDKYSKWDSFKTAPALYRDIAGRSEITVDVLESNTPDSIEDGVTSVTSKAGLIVRFKNNQGVTNDKKTHMNKFQMTVNYKYDETKEKWAIDSYTIDSIDKKQTIS